MYSLKIFLIGLLVIGISGCAISFYKGRPSDRERIERLSTELENIKEERETEQQQLRQTQALLEQKLKSEIDGQQLKLELAQRGLVITFIDEILFDSGKANIKSQGYSVLDKVSEVIKEKVSDKNISIEGHTDNQPIKHSGWKSNWELSLARATSVLHYLEGKGIDPRRLQATGYGEYRPVASNEAEAGRQKNRRVEIIILPNILDILPVELKKEYSEIQNPASYK